MIVRKALIQHGRRLAQSPKKWTRSLATETDLHDLQDTTEAIDNSLSNATLETQSIESLAEKSGVQYVPQIDARTQMSQQLLGDGTKYVYDRHRRQQKLQNPLGTTVDKGYQPHRLLTDPPRPSDITLELLLASQAHLGHKTSHWNPANSRYIFGIRQGIHIISLDVTAAHLRRACRVVSSVAERGGLILFVGTRPGQDRCVVTAATMAGGCHLFDRWTPGSITNGDQILRSCRKQVVDEFDREVPEQGAALKDASALKPDLVVCMNPIENWVMLHECGMHGVPTIGIIDTDADPTWVTYPIPANDDSLRCVQVIAGALGRAGQEGQANRREAALAGEVTYRPNRPKRMADRMNASSRAVEAATGLANTGDSGMGPAADGGANRSRNSEVDKNLGYHRAELGS